MNNANTQLRDLLLFGLLVILLVNAYKNAYSFLMLHKDSVIHELDRSFADQLYTAQRQARIAKTILEKAHIIDDREKTVVKLTEKLQQIEQKYTKNSPGLLFLGPLGTASIVLKEKELAAQLLEVINNIGSILVTLMPPHTKYIAALSIDTGLQNNQQFISSLLKVT